MKRVITLLLASALVVSCVKKEKYVEYPIDPTYNLVLVQEPVDAEVWESISSPGSEWSLRNMHEKIDGYIWKFYDGGTREGKSLIFIDNNRCTIDGTKMTWKADLEYSLLYIGNKRYTMHNVTDTSLYLLDEKNFLHRLTRL